MDIIKFKQLPVLGILRGIKVDSIDRLTEAVTCAGLKTIEITMDTPNAVNSISRMVKRSEGRLTVGAGTVLTVDKARNAVDSGAEFIVSPVIVPEVMEYCTKNNIASFPGAFTPKEVFDAWNLGAAMVKVFPVKFFGPTYIKELKAPLNNIELLACGGVNKENLKDYFSAGASAVAFGSSIFKKEWIEENKFNTIIELIKNFIQAYSNSSTT
ncbi:MAG: bifunctional 4-hydroxy-2-oxoglutarate aldolase/2-dehydro-3-deoxy-phosphogluconate aldolase [bacterium]